MSSGIEISLINSQRCTNCQRKNIIQKNKYFLCLLVLKYRAFISIMERGNLEHPNIRRRFMGSLLFWFVKNELLSTLNYKFTMN